MESSDQPQLQTKPKLFCFVLMPFAPEFEDVYKIGIKEACHLAGAYCERVDEQFFSERILDRIYNQIAKADLVIADMTGRNPNVFYEVGYAHALGKPTVLLTQKVEDIPFDLKHFPHIVYEGKIGSLRDGLSKRVAWHCNNPSVRLEETAFPLELHLNGKSLDAGPASIVQGKIRAFQLHIVAGNRGYKPLAESDYKLMLVTSKQIKRVDSPDLSSFPMVDLPDGRRQFLLPSFGTLLPSEFNDFTVRAYSPGQSLTLPDELVLRVLSIYGNRDFILTAQPDSLEKA